jgi:hypothetical protein
MRGAGIDLEIEIYSMKLAPLHPPLPLLISCIGGHEFVSLASIME